MNNSEKHIVAIDLGTSKVALTVARVTGDNVQIVYYKETPSYGVRYSSIYNVKQASGPLAEAIMQAEHELGIKITQAILGMPRFPIVQENCTATADRGEYTMITSEEVTRLKNFAQSLHVLDDDEREAIYGSVAQSFSDGENFQIIESDIIGMPSNTLEGNFKLFIGKKNDLTKIDSAMNLIGVAAMRKYFTAESTASAVLSGSEMENGVALIDFGGGCTSVSIYQGKIMRHFASIPFGGKNITQDIMSECQISESLAENIKLAYGACMPEKLQNLGEKILLIKSDEGEPDKQLPVKYLSEIISARVEEIIMAVLYEIEQSKFADSLRSGIVITGGSANLANLVGFVNDISGYKVRIGYPRYCFSHQGYTELQGTSAATSIGLIHAAVNDELVTCAFSDEEAGFVSSNEEAPKVEIDNEGQYIIFPAETEKQTEQQSVTPKAAKSRTSSSGEQKANSIRVKLEKFGKKVKEVLYDMYEKVNEDEDEDEENLEENNKNTSESAE